MKEFASTFALTVALLLCSNFADAQSSNNPLVPGPAEKATPIIQVPTSFTPNGDGRNDQLIFSAGDLKMQLFAIYNRWGDLMFSTTQSEQGWDGSSAKRGNCETGVYFWVMKYTNEEGKVLETAGHVTLLR